MSRVRTRESEAGDIVAYSECAIRANHQNVEYWCVFNIQFSISI